MRAAVVVVRDKAIELALEFGEVEGGLLFGEELLFGLVEPFDFAAGLWGGRGGSV